MAKQDPPKKGSNSSKAQPPKDDYKAGIKQWFIDYYNSPAFKRNFMTAQRQWSKEDEYPQTKEAAINAVKNIKDIETGVSIPRTIDSKIYFKNDLGIETPLVYAHEASHVSDPYIVPSTPSNAFFVYNRNIGPKNILAENIKRGDKPGSPGYDIPTRNIKEWPQEIHSLWQRVQDLKKENDFWGIKDVLQSKNIELEKRSHDPAHGEVRGDINALRYLLANKGIWDITKSNPGTFNVDMLNKLYKLPEVNAGPKSKYNPPAERKDVKTPYSPGMILKRLRQQYSDDDIMWMINNLAKKEGDDTKENYV